MPPEIRRSQILLLLLCCPAICARVLGNDDEDGDDDDDDDDSRRAARECVLSSAAVSISAQIFNARLTFTRVCECTIHDTCMYTFMQRHVCACVFGARGPGLAVRSSREACALVLKIRSFGGGADMHRCTHTQTHMQRV